MAAATAHETYFAIPPDRNRHTTMSDR